MDQMDTSGFDILDTDKNAVLKEISSALETLISKTSQEAETAQKKKLSLPESEVKKIMANRFTMSETTQSKTLNPIFKEWCGNNKNNESYVLCFLRDLLVKSGSMTPLFIVVSPRPVVCRRRTRSRTTGHSAAAYRSRAASSR
jgi:hypothetical protein